MNKIMLMFLILAASAAGICFAGENNTGNAPNPPAIGNGGPNSVGNSMDNSTDNSMVNSDTNSTGNNM